MMPLPMLPQRQQMPEVEEVELPEEEILEDATVHITPESVCYRDEQQVCANCVYMDADGSCRALGIPVDPGAGCNLFKGGDGD